MGRGIHKIIMMSVIVFTFSGCYNAIENTLLQGDYENALQTAA